MEARILSATMIVASTLSLGASYRTQNFIITAPTAELAREIGDSAESYRRDLAIEWLGEELPPWRGPCPVTAHVGPHLGAGGQTSFMFDRGVPFGWSMIIQGSRERLLDSVLPHEVTHTIFATHFGRPLPRWADEGACTTVEHVAEKSKQHKMLYTFLTTGRGIAFNRMFAMKEYPKDILPLYSQGYSLARFLIAQGGKQRFIQYVGDGMRSRNWTATTKEYYGFTSLSDLQVTWLDWVRKGCPAIKPDNTMLAAADTQRQDGAHDGIVVRPVSHGAAEAVQVTKDTKPAPTSDSWYLAQREKAQGRRAADASVGTTRQAIPNNVGDGSINGTSVMHNSVTRPQPVGTPQQIVIPPSPQPVSQYTVPPMVPVPRTLVQPAYPSYPSSRY